MADKLISALPEATSIAGNDLLVTEQTSIAKKITADNLLTSLATLWTAHGGVESFDLVSTSGLSKTYRMTYADDTYTDITITDGTGITDIVTTTSGLTHTITISLNDGTTKVFTVDDGVGISSISAPSSVGLEDTYTINYSDGSTSTFTVTNGASVSSITLNGTTITFTKDDGNMIDLSVPTLRIRYSVTQPDDDNDIITTPSNWMGVAWALDSAVLHYTDYSWFKIKGETGDNAEVSSYTRQYKYDADGTQAPTTGYYSTIAAAQSAVGGAIQGKYLWIATTVTWNNGTPTVIYSASYQGLDGSGLSGVVKSIYMADTGVSLSPDSNGQVTISDADIGSIADPATKSDGQVLTWDATDQVWYAGSVSTGTVNSVNSQLPDAGGNVALKGTDIPIDSTPTANVAVVTDANGKFKASTATATEVGYLSGVTGAIQTQINGKASTSNLTDGSVTKVGTSTVGSTSKPIYLNNGTPTACGSSLTDYVPLAGGTMTGDLTVTDTTGVAEARVRNNLRDGAIHASSAGNLGIYDHTNSVWVIKSATDQSVDIPHLVTCTTPDMGDNSTKVATTAFVNRFVQHGDSGAVSVAAGSYTDVSITFPTAFASGTPTIVLTLASNSTAVAAYAAIQFAVFNRSTTGFTLRVYNADSSSRAPNVCWLAVV